MQTCGSGLGYRSSMQPLVGSQRWHGRLTSPNAANRDGACKTMTTADGVMVQLICKAAYLCKPHAESSLPMDA